MHLNLHLHCPIHDSFRVQQVLGMFDMPLQGSASEHFSVELPDLSAPWQIGVIVGPTGSGKTAVAKAAFGEHLYRGADWPHDRAVIDGFGDLPIRTITQTLTAVGFSSPPAWVKPYAVLSNGEKFRCDLARAILRTEDSGLTPEWKDRARPAPSPLYSGERAGVRGDSSSEPHCSTSCAAPPLTLPSPPSTGEREQKQMSPRYSVSAQSPALSPPLTVFDEFTSLVDRTVARIGSAAVARAIRSGKISTRFVAVTCHYDVVPWLAPDWVLDMATQTLTTERLRRPDLRLDIRRCDRSAWSVFQRHHYLSGHLHRSSQCYVGYVDEQPAAFTAVLPFPHPRRPGWREHRTVCLPDYQGIGIGAAMSAYIASLYVATAKPYFSRSGHPAVIHHRAHSPLWKMTRRPGMVSRMGSSGAGKTGMQAMMSLGRLTAGFEYVGPPRVEEARKLGLVAA